MGGEAAEDCERSVRYFFNDSVILRYQMYSVKSAPYMNAGGLQRLFRTRVHRKKAEYDHLVRLQEKFPALIGLAAKRTFRTVSAKFRSLGMEPLHPKGSWYAARGAVAHCCPHHSLAGA